MSQRNIKRNRSSYENGVDVDSGRSASSRLPPGSVPRQAQNQTSDGIPRHNSMRSNGSSTRSEHVPISPTFSSSTRQDSGEPSAFQQHQQQHNSNGAAPTAATSPDASPVLSNAATLEQSRYQKPRRQAPVSCKLCRVKKLRCDRGQPCSNCRTRGYRCEPFDGLPENEYRPPLQTAAPAANVVTASASHGSNETVEARLARLERLYLQLQDPDSQPRRDVPSRPPQPSSYRDTSVVMPNGRFVNSLFSATRDKKPFQISDLLVLLPSYQDAECIYQNYIDNVSWLYHVCHHPTLKAQLVEVYQYRGNQKSQKEQQPVAATAAPDQSNAATAAWGDVTPTSEDAMPAKLSLVFTILSCSMYFWNPQQGIEVTPEEAKRKAKEWGSASESILAEYISKGSFSLETMQSTILLTTLIPNTGIVTSYLLLLSMLGPFAKALGLHQVDSKKAVAERRKPGAKVNYVELEVKRRVWWHIVSSDWIMSYMAGPQLGTYSMNPKHFNVDEPSNVDDANITNDGNYARPLSEPTEMSYFLTRNKMGQFCKEVVDLINEQQISPTEDLDYDTVKELDSMFRRYLKVVPEFFHEENRHKPHIARLFRERPGITHMANMFSISWNFRLTKLHRPFLLEASRDRKYNFCRDRCLAAARTIHRIKRNMDSEEPKFMPSVTRVWTVIHHTFMATLILVMDLQSNRNAADAAHRRWEIVECCRDLDRSRAESAIAARGIETLVSISRRSGLRLCTEVRGGSNPFRELEPSEKQAISQISGSCSRANSPTDVDSLGASASRAKCLDNLGPERGRRRVDLSLATMMENEEEDAEADMSRNTAGAQPISEDDMPALYTQLFGDIFASPVTSNVEKQYQPQPQSSNPAQTNAAMARGPMPPHQPLSQPLPQPRQFYDSVSPEARMQMAPQQQTPLPYSNAPVEDYLDPMAIVWTQLNDQLERNGAVFSFGEDEMDAAAQPGMGAGMMAPNPMGTQYNDGIRQMNLGGYYTTVDGVAYPVAPNQGNVQYNPVNSAMGQSWM